MKGNRANYEEVNQACFTKSTILNNRNESQKRTEGTGLGLSITNDIIKAHGGALEIHSKEEGTIMAVTLNQP